MSSLRKLFDTDCNGDAVDPTETYIVHPVGLGVSSAYELVSGEDLLAAAELFDQMLQEKDSKDDTDNI